MVFFYCSATQIQSQQKYLALSAAHVSASWMSEIRATMVCNYQGKIHRLVFKDDVQKKLSVW